MDCAVKNSKNEVSIKKRVFEKKSIRRDGLLLQVHHTLDGEAKPIRFLHAVFQEGTDNLAVSDANGNLFMIDLAFNRFWALPNMTYCSGIAFPPYDKTLIFISSSNCDIKIVNIETGKEQYCLQGHKLPPSQLTFGGEGGKWLLSAASSLQERNSGIESSPSVEQTGEALVWDLNSCSIAHRLNIRPDSGISRALFMDGASSGQILVCFADDAMFVWQLGNFESVKQILPGITSEGKYSVKAVAVTRNGRAMVVGGKSHSIVIFSLETWTAQKIIELPAGICGIKELQFLPQPFDGGCNSVLVILASTSQVYLMDLQTSTFIGNFSVMGRKSIRKLICSHSGRYIACVLNSGEVNIYSSGKVMENRFNRDVEIPVVKGTHIEKDFGKVFNTKVKSEHLATSKKLPLQRMGVHSSMVDKEILSELNPHRLLPILRQYGEFPSRYRLLAWRKALLQLPCNRKAYASLVKRGIHPSFSHLEEKYPLENVTELKHLKRLLSCLAHWCPLFSQVIYLPLFSYPFVKLFCHDPLSCFEAVVTIIINYCQHWFEFFPFPPINALAAVENLIAHHDLDLFQHFVQNGIDTRVYAWPMLKVVFSEVLSNEEWLRLWDHILANEPSFLMAAVPAYCIVCRAALLNCSNIEDFQCFFQNQNPINMDEFISKIYKINKSTPEKLHPRKYLQDFKCLPEGDTYPVFNQYPKIVVDGHAEKLEKLQEEEEVIIRKELAVLKMLREKEEQKILAENELIKQRHLAEIENVYQMALKDEEKKLKKRHLEVIALKKELAEVEVATGNRLRKKEDDTNLQLLTIKRLLKDLEKKVYDANKEPTCSKDVRISTSEGVHLPLSSKSSKSCRLNTRTFQFSKGNEEEFPATSSINNPRKNIRNQKHKSRRPTHKFEGRILRSKEAEIERFQESNGQFEKEKILSSISSEGENCRINEVDSISEYCHCSTNEQTQESCFTYSPQRKYLREKDLMPESSCNKAVLPGNQNAKEEVDDIQFIKEKETQRWHLDHRNSGRKAFCKSFYHNELSTLRNKAFYSEEQEAIQRAIESRASLISARKGTSLESKMKIIS